MKNETTGLNYPPHNNLVKEYKCPTTNCIGKLSDIVSWEPNQNECGACGSQLCLRTLKNKIENL